MGPSALEFNSTGSQNSAIGQNALRNNIGNLNAVLGYQAGQNLTTGNNNIAIGSNTDFTSSTGSNQLNIGNWIYGSGGNIGIGTNTPTGILDLVSGS